MHCINQGVLLYGINSTLLTYHFFTASFSFCQIYLHCPLELAILQNAQRSVSLSEDTIRKMFRRIEKPDPKKFNWERLSVTISSGSGQSDDKWYATNFLIFLFSITNQDKHYTLICLFCDMQIFLTSH